MPNPEISVENLIDELIAHWRLWDKHENFYLTTLAPSLVLDMSQGDKKEQEILGTLRDQLSASRWERLPELIAQRRHDLARAVEQARVRAEEERNRRVEEEAAAAQRRAAEEEERRQREIQEKLDAEAARENKRLALEELRSQLKEDYLGVDAAYSQSYSEFISVEVFEEEKTAFVQNWANANLGTDNSGRQILVDSEQAAAIATVNNHVQLIARAGSGKTTTLVGRAVFLQKHCHIPPDQILLLAFNREAAKEVRKRLERVFGDAIPHVMTFHALAYAIVHPEERLLADDFRKQELTLSSVVQQIIDDHLRQPQESHEIRKMMLSHFRGAWEAIEEGGYEREKEEFLEFRRSLAQRSIKGEFVKSFGEKTIADFLFEHDVDYHYEWNFWWSGRNYRPDFTLPFGDSRGIVIEYFGLQGSTDYDEMTDEKRQYWKENPNWALIEIYPKDLIHGKESFWAHLRELLGGYGVTCHQLSDDELWARLQDRAVDRVSFAVANFIGRCRKSLIFANDLNDLIRTHLPASEAEGLFLPIAHKIYSKYLAALSATGDDDFDGLMQRATDKLIGGETVFARANSQGDLRNLRHVLVDEFQDFSLLFQKMVEAIRQQSPKVECFCVGDDWQAINGFAGSDLKFFKDFDRYFQNPKKLYLSTNYRSPASIVEVSNQVMKGMGKAASAYQRRAGQVLSIDTETFSSSVVEREEHGGDVITPIVLRLVRKSVSDGEAVALLSRTNSLSWSINYQEISATRDLLGRYLELIRSYLSDNDRKLVSISTTHGFKGRERTHVVVLDAIDHAYPLIHPDWVFSRVFGDDESKLLDEERRLFYVALSRAERKLTIITRGDCESPFLSAIKRNASIQNIDWSDYPERPRSGRTIVRVYNQVRRGSRPTVQIKNDLRAAGYRWQSTEPSGWVKTFQADGFTIDLLRAESWVGKADGIEIEIVRADDDAPLLFQVDDGDWQEKGDI